MKTKIVKIGNSQGIRIPKVLLEQSGLQGDVELEVKDKQLIIKPMRTIRHNWGDAFRLMTARGDDQLLDKDSCQEQSSFDKEEWEW